MYVSRAEMDRRARERSIYANFPGRRTPGTDAIVNALHDLRDQVRDLEGRFDDLPAPTDDESLASELRELSERIDQLES